MNYRKPIVISCITLAAAGPALELRPVLDCNPHVQLCGLSDAAYLPDEPAPEHAPQLVVAAQATASVSSASVSTGAMYPFAQPFKT